MEKILIGLDGSRTVVEMTEKEILDNSGPPPNYERLRRDEYAKRGVTFEKLIVAMFEQDAAEIQRLQAIRQQVKSDIPKPLEARK